METTQEKEQKFRPTEWPSVGPGFGANHFPSLRSVRAHLTTITAGLQLAELHTDGPPAWQTDLLRQGQRHSGGQICSRATVAAHDLRCLLHWSLQTRTRSSSITRAVHDLRRRKSHTTIGSLTKGRHRD